MKTFTWNSTSWFTRAVDCFQEVIHTHEVNLEESSNTRLFYEFINDFLYQAMEEREGKLVAQAGEISAGSPCQSFSTATRRKGSSQRLLNMFMIASVLSYVDYYRPQYAFPKNILDMAKCGVNGKEENVFAQVICDLVDMERQVRSFCLDAWSFDSPWSRTRLFISITAPGLTPLLDPPQTHAHPDEPSGPNAWPPGRYSGVEGRVHRRAPRPSGLNAWPPGRYSGVEGRVHRRAPRPSGPNGWPPDR